MRVALVAGGALVLVLLFVALAGGGGSGGGVDRAVLAADIHELAGRVKTGDGPQGPEAAERLDTVADHVKAGGGADEANALLADAAVWTQQGSLSAPASQAMAALLAKIDGVDPALATPTTTAPPPTTVAPTTQPPAPPPQDEDEGENGKRRGKGRGD